MNKIEMNKIENVHVLGMDLERHTYKSCVADFGTEDDWATVYNIKSKEEGKGHATQLMRNAKDHYKGKRIGISYPLHPAMEAIATKLGYVIYS